MTKSADDMQLEIAKYLADLIDDEKLWARVTPIGAVEILSEVGAFIAGQEARAVRLEILLRVARERGDNYRDQARTANKKIEARRAEPSIDGLG